MYVSLPTINSVGEAAQADGYTFGSGFPIMLPSQVAAQARHQTVGL